MKTKLTIFLFLLLTQISVAQVTTLEDFESQSYDATSFISNGQTFNIVGNAFSINILESFGWNGNNIDNVFIDNYTLANNATFSIKTNNGAKFNVQSFWVWILDGNYNFSSNGSLTLVGKLEGKTIFTTTINSGFNQDPYHNNGYTLINLTNVNGQDFSKNRIDEIKLSLGGDFQYIALDAFRWTKIPPVAHGTGNIVYVNKNVINEFGNGSSWTNAVRELHEALDYATQNSSSWTTSNPLKIWVAAGEYIPKTDTAFVMVENVEIYGGFSGTESQLAQRDWVTNISKLIGNNLNKVIINFNNNLTSAAILDGFYIYNNGDIYTTGHEMKNYNSSPLVKNCIFTNQSGYSRGMYNYNANPIITNCTFESIYSSNDKGAAMYNENCSIILTKCTFKKNNTYMKCSAIYNKNSILKIDSCNISNNYASFGGGSIYNEKSSYEITNSVFSNNRGSGDGGAIYNDNSNGVIKNCKFNDNQATSGSGGAIFNNNNSSSDISDSEFTKSYTTGSYGNITNMHYSSSKITNCSFYSNVGVINGGIAAYDNSSAEVNHCIFDGNESFTNSGGAIWVSDNSTMSIKNSVFIKSKGGAIYSRGYTLVIDSCQFIKNYNNNSGGAIFNDANGHITVKNSNFRSNESPISGAIHTYSTTDIINCRFSANYSYGYGAAVSYLSSSGKIINSLFSGNKANSGGAAVYNASSSPIIKNCTFTSNYSGNNGGAIANDIGSNPEIYNCIIIGNDASNGIKGIQNKNNSIPVIKYSLVEDSTRTDNGNLSSAGILAQDIFNNYIPVSSDTTYAGDYTLKNTAIVINKAGNHLYKPATPDTDLAGNSRYRDNILDLGAYEYQSGNFVMMKPDTNGVLYVNKGGKGNNEGSSWQNSTAEVSTALYVTDYNLDIKEIWAAKGIYTPAYRADNNSALNPDDRDNAFVLKDSMKLYGGFEGTESDIENRNPATNETILNGELGNNTNKTDNARHVVIMTDGNTTLNGFTIQNGYATGLQTINVKGQTVWNISGAGVYVIGAGKKTITNNKFIFNAAQTFGGGIYAEGGEGNNIANNLFWYGWASQGGGIRTNNSLNTIVNNTFYYNTAATSGGGIYANLGTNQISNNIFQANQKGTNNSVANADVANDNSTISVTYNLLQTNSSFGSGTGNIITDAQFADAANGDFTLKNTSPALNSGLNSGYDPVLLGNKDLAGNARIYNGINNSTIDMGAYEFQGESISTDLKNSMTENVRIYPNPVVNGQTTIYTEKSSRASLLDITGKIVQIYNFNSGVNQIKLNKNINSGVYLLRFDNGVQLKLLVK